MWLIKVCSIFISLFIYLFFTEDIHSDNFPFGSSYKSFLFGLMNTADCVHEQVLSINMDLGRDTLGDLQRENQ